MIAEYLLLSLLVIYFLAFIALGLLKGRHYLGSYAEGKDLKDYFFHSQNFSLTMAGLSVTAIALIVGLRFDRLDSFNGTLSFFSISFITLALSWNLIRFPRVYYHYISNILCEIGVLSRLWFSYFLLSFSANFLF